MRKMLNWLLVLWFVGVFVAVFVGYFISGSGTAGAVDGFGRALSDSPIFMRFLFGQQRQWAGYGWFLADMVAFWGSIILIFKVYGWNNPE